MAALVNVSNMPDEWPGHFISSSEHYLGWVVGLGICGHLSPWSFSLGSGVPVSFMVQWGGSKSNSLFSYQWGKEKASKQQQGWLSSPYKNADPIQEPLYGKGRQKYRTKLGLCAQGSGTSIPLSVLITTMEIIGILSNIFLKLHSLQLLKLNICANLHSIWTLKLQFGN